MNTQELQQTLELIRKAQATPMGDPRLDGLAKSTFAQSASATSGLTFYDLELGAKLLYPVLTPLRNSIPRVSGKGGIQAAWRAITGINSNGLRVGVSGGNRGGVMAVTTADYTAAYKGIGIESNVDFEAQYAGQGFDDVRALAAKTGLEALMLGEESMLLGGNTSVALGTTPTPTVVDASDTGGTFLHATAYYVVCVALTLDGFLNGTVAGGIQAAITRTNADSSTDTFGGGSAQKSASGTVTTGSGTGAVDTHTISASVTAVNGAVGYAWFVGTASGTTVLTAITTINSVLLTSPTPAGTQTAASLPSSDNSTNALAFDGLMYQTVKSGNNGYVATQAKGTNGTGTPLTSDGYGGVVEIETMLKSMWDNYRLSPDTIWVNSQEAKNISTKILAGSANASQRFVFESVQDMIGGGVMVRTYFNRYSLTGAKSIDIKIHPNLPAGTLLATTSQLPYPLSNVSNVMQVRTRQDYYQIEWPLRSRKYEYGVYADEVLQHYFPPSMGIITNIGNG
jgi:hypothetical protein